MADYTIESVQRAIRVLGVLSRSTEGMSLVDISHDMGLGKASVYRLLFTLTQDELVTRDAESKRYKLGSALIALGQRALESTSIVDASTPLMNELAAAHPIVVYLNLPTREAVLSTVRLPRSGRGDFVNPGVSMPYHACASGLVFMAYDNALLEAVLSRGLPRLASGTIVVEQDLRDAVRRVHKQGYARDLDTLEEGVASVAAPIFGQDGTVVATIGATGPSGALDRPRWRTLARDAVVTADKVSYAIGGSGSSNSRELR